MKEKHDESATTSKEVLNNPQKSNHISREERVANHLTTHEHPEQRKQQNACCGTTKNTKQGDRCC